MWVKIKNYWWLWEIAYRHTVLYANCKQPQNRGFGWHPFKIAGMEDPFRHAYFYYDWICLAYLIMES
jgi:hypothetical protein